MGIDLVLSMDELGNRAGNKTNKYAPQTKGNSTKELVDVLVRVSHRQEIDLDR